MMLICHSVKVKKASRVVIEFTGIKVCFVTAYSQELWKKRSHGFYLWDEHNQDTDGKNKLWNSGMKLWDL